MATQKTDESQPTSKTPEKTPPEPAARLPRWKKLLFAVVVLFGFFIAAEIVTRLVFLIGGRDINRYRLRTRQETKNPGEFTRSRFMAHPFLPFAPRPYDERTIRIPRPLIGKTLSYSYRNNSLGCRGREVVVPKPKGVKRILIFGASTTWDGPNDETTWPALLEKELRKRYGTNKIEVVNFGVDGGISPMSLIRFALLGLDLEPDLVITYHGANDIFLFCYNNLKGDYTPFVESIRPDLPMPLQYRLPRFLMASYVVTLVTHRIDRGGFQYHLSREIYPNFDKYEDQKGDGIQKIDYFLRNLKTMRGMAREYGAGFLGATFHWMHGNDTTQRFNARLRKFFDKEKIPYADVDNKLPKKDLSVHVDEVHFTVEGLKRMANIFADKIVEENLLEHGKTETDSND